MEGMETHKLAIPKVQNKIQQQCGNRLLRQVPQRPTCWEQKTQNLVSNATVCRWDPPPPGVTTVCVLRDGSLLSGAAYPEARFAPLHSLLSCGWLQDESSEALATGSRLWNHAQYKRLQSLDDEEYCFLLWQQEAFFQRDSPVLPSLLFSPQMTTSWAEMLLLHLRAESNLDKNLGGAHCICTPSYSLEMPHSTILSCVASSDGESTCLCMQVG